MNKKLLIISWIMVISLFLVACVDRRFLYIQPTVVNMEDLNTEYDEFNTAAPPFYRAQGDLVFFTYYLNTRYNEYRPALFKKYTNLTRVTDNMIMIFSSDRPGGKGGYDLYLAVLPLDIFD